MKSIGHASVAMNLLLILSATTVSIAAEDGKLVNTTLYAHNPNGYNRWSGGSILSLGDQQRLMMLVSAHDGTSDHSPAKILRFDSNDGGLTWTTLEQAQVFQDSMGFNYAAAPSLVRLSSTDILCLFSVSKSQWDEGTWMKRSTDNGATWSAPTPLPYDGYGGVNPDGALLLSNGRIVAPAWVSFDQLASAYSYCFYSDDQGATWQKSDYMTTPKGSIGRPTDPAAEEPSVIELADGRLMMLMRTYLGSFYKSYSDDFGTTWSTPEPSGIKAPGAMPKLARLSNGDILLLYNAAMDESEINGPWPRKYLAAAISKDEGETFGPMQLLDGGPDYPGKITMPNVTFFNGNAIITYSRSADMTNSYDWRLQVIPEPWFAAHTPEPTSAVLLMTAVAGTIGYACYQKTLKCK